MLRHHTARSVRAFSIRLGGNPEVSVNADADGILRAPPPRRGDPIENGPQIEEAFPDVAESLLSLYPALIADERPKPAPADEEPAPVPPPAPRRTPTPKPPKEADAE